MELEGLIKGPEGTPYEGGARRRAASAASAATDLPPRAQASTRSVSKSRTGTRSSRRRCSAAGRAGFARSPG